MITTGLTMVEYYESEFYTECPYDYKCEECWFDCGDDDHD